MKIYIDTGVFIDYLAERSPTGSYLRTAPRRGRTVSQLSDDGTQLLERIKSKHQGLTSCLTLYEVETILYQTLASFYGGRSDSRRYLVISARSLTTQVMSVLERHNIEVMDLTLELFKNTVAEIELQARAIEAGDSLHITTAIINNAEVIVSSDRDLLNLDGLLRNKNGNIIQCLDTDRALLLL